MHQGSHGRSVREPLGDKKEEDDKQSGLHYQNNHKSKKERRNLYMRGRLLSQCCLLRGAAKLSMLRSDLA